MSNTIGHNDLTRDRSMSRDRPVEVAPRVWWVGAVLEGDLFQSHAYLIESGDRSVLVDPGSALTIDVTLEKVRQIVPLENVRYLLAHHSDPDCVAGLGRLGEVLDTERTTLVTEWRSDLLIRHYGNPFRVETIEDLHGELALSREQVLRFIPTPYLHFPGAFVTYLPDSHSLLSADLFGGFNPGVRLFADSIEDFEDLRSFHEHYMPSREILLAGLVGIRTAAGPIDRILPQHGYVIDGDLVDPMFDKLMQLECGAMAQTQGDVHLRTLIEHASIVHRLADDLAAATDIRGVARAAHSDLVQIMPLESVSIEIATSAGQIVSLAERDGEPVWTMIPTWSVSDDRTVVLPIPEQIDVPTCAAVVRFTQAHELETHLYPMLRMLAPTVQALAVRVAREHDVEQAVRDLEDDASRDSLTGLWNRRPMAKTGHRTPGTGVLLLDIDHFKAVNDTFGHGVGDDILRQLADTLTLSTRSIDQVIRFGGEEFVVLVADAEPAVLTRTAERLRAAVERSVRTPSGPITVSIGVAVVHHGEDLDDTLRRADAALYVAKRQGRNRVVIHDDSMENPAQD